MSEDVHVQGHRGEWAPDLANAQQGITNFEVTSSFEFLSLNYQRAGVAAMAMSSVAFNRAPTWPLTLVDPSSRSYLRTGPSSATFTLTSPQWSLIDPSLLEIPCSTLAGLTLQALAPRSPLPQLADSD